MLYFNGKKVESMFGQSQTVYVGQSLILFQSLSVNLYKKKRIKKTYMFVFKCLNLSCRLLFRQENRFWQQY